MGNLIPWWSIGQRLLSVLLVISLLWAAAPTTALAQSISPSEDAAADQSIQPYIDRALERVTEFTLDNGIKFIVMERHQAPVVSFMTYVNVGAAEEADGKTGAAHYLEHLAFKGTRQIGTTNYDAEKEVLEKLDGLFDQIKAAQETEDAEALASLLADFDETQAMASQYVIQNQLPLIVQRAGGVGLNATTSADATRYFYSFPSNKLELWMSLESERFLDPVFREFYEEKEVILEERRMRVDNSPIGRMVEEFLATAFTTHPYRRPTIGYADDLQAMTREDVREFFETYYVPNRMIMAVVGDVDPAAVQRLATTYFGRYPARPPAPEMAVVEPTQTELREITLRLPSQPWYMEGYHRPGINHPDHLVYQIINSILSGGRTSRLYKSLVEEKQIALAAQSFDGLPGDRFPNLIMFYALTAPGHTVEELADAFRIEIERLRTEPVSEQELERVKTQARAGLLGILSSNQGMASLLPEYEAKTGSWRNLFEDLKALEEITAADVMRVAQATFRPENRTVGKILPQDDQSQP
ncbi:MAG: pitrilysin family protein [Synechococcales bacterium]|nr:pitrilysin family protein [Synechococcales bacterium]